ncbi:MAG: hypothetical protein KDA41_05930, partial [Planctomycetales bacterium]|nr:hypothetical protein [Planctomycetales bacterium]
ARMRFDLLVSDFTLAATRDRKIVIFGEQFWRPFVHVADIAAAFQRVLEASPELVSGQVFNVGMNANNCQKLQLAELVQSHVPGTEIETVRRDHDPRSYRVEFAKIARVLDYTPAWTVEDGVRECRDALQSGLWRDPSDARYTN